MTSKNRARFHFFCCSIMFFFFAAATWPARAQETEAELLPMAAVHCRYRSSGKTTLISSFLDIDLPTPAKPTLGIECAPASLVPSSPKPHPICIPRYKFARRSNAADGSMKDIAHIWEIAGGLASLDLLKVTHRLHARVSHPSSFTTRYRSPPNQPPLPPSPSS